MLMASIIISIIEMRGFHVNKMVYNLACSILHYVIYFLNHYKDCVFIIFLRKHELQIFD